MGCRGDTVRRPQMHNYALARFNETPLPVSGDCAAGHSAAGEPPARLYRCGDMVRRAMARRAFQRIAQRPRRHKRPARCVCRGEPLARPQFHNYGIGRFTESSLPMPCVMMRRTPSQRKLGGNRITGLLRETMRGRGIFHTRAAGIAIAFSAQRLFVLVGLRRLYPPRLRLPAALRALQSGPRAAPGVGCCRRLCPLLAGGRL